MYSFEAHDDVSQDTKDIETAQAQQLLGRRAYKRTIEQVEEGFERLSITT